MKFDLAHQTRPRIGEEWNGDSVWVGEWIHRPVFAVFDGTGHGKEAHDASALACDILVRWDGTLDLRALASRLHEELRGSRGTAGLIAALDGDVLRGFGVGNVEMRAIGRTIPALLTPGILGVRLRRRVHVFEISLNVGDRLLVCSDGIHSRFDADQHEGLSPAGLCDSLIREHSRSHDDATVLVADVQD